MSVVTFACPGGVLAGLGGRVQLRLIVPVAILFFFRHFPGCVCPWCVVVLCFVPPFHSSLRSFRPWVHLVSTPCGCPPAVYFFLLLLYPALSALRLGGSGLPAPPSSVFCFFCAPTARWFPPLDALGLATVWLGFFFLPPVRPFVWCVRCVLVLCPPQSPSRLLLLFCGVWHASYQNTRARTVQGGYIGLWQACEHTPTENTGCGHPRYGITKIH